MIALSTCTKITQKKLPTSKNVWNSWNNVCVPNWSQLQRDNVTPLLLDAPPILRPRVHLALKSMPMDCELRKVTSTGLSYTFGYICLNRTTFKRNCEGSASDNVVLQQGLVVSSCVSLCSHSLNAVHSNMCATTVGEGVQLCVHAHFSQESLEHGSVQVHYAFWNSDISYWVCLELSTRQWHHHLVMWRKTVIKDGWFLIW